MRKKKTLRAVSGAEKNPPDLTHNLPVNGLSLLRERQGKRSEMVGKGQGDMQGFSQIIWLSERAGRRRPWMKDLSALLYFPHVQQITLHKALGCTVKKRSGNVSSKMCLNTGTSSYIFHALMHCQQYCCPTGGEGGRCMQELYSICTQAYLLFAQFV